MQLFEINSKINQLNNRQDECSALMEVAPFFHLPLKAMRKILMASREIQEKFFVYIEYVK
jgi:hypothetical protein